MMKSSQAEELYDPILPDSEKEATLVGTQRKPRGWKCMPFIVGNSGFEKVASYGLTGNLTVYMVRYYNMEQVVAANVGNIFAGTANLTPLMGAFVSDSYWGRFRTLACASVISLLGMVALTMTSSAPQLRPPSCTQESLRAWQCIQPTDTQLGFLFFSLGLLAIGAGGVRPCCLPFGVDQFDRTTLQGQKGINSFFNWYNWTECVAVIISSTLVLYIQENISWSIGFGIPAGLMILAIILFFLGSRLYVHVQPKGSIISGIVRVFVAAYRKRNLVLPPVGDVEQQESLFYDPISNGVTMEKLPLSQQFRFLNKAAIKCVGELSVNSSPMNLWRLCSIQQVEEAKCFLRITPIWASGIISCLALTQQWSFVVLQSLKMDRSLGPHFQIPAGSMNTISLLSMIIFIPIYDVFLVPMARRVTKIERGITLLQRQGVGIVMSVLSMVVAALVEKKRRDSAMSHDGVPSMSVLWLAPQLALTGITEAFSLIGQSEFYNSEFPDHMQTLACSLSYLNQAGASYLTSILVYFIRASTGGGSQASWLDNDLNIGRLDYFYYLIAAIGIMNLFYFLVCAHFYHYKRM